MKVSDQIRATNAGDLPRLSGLLTTHDFGLGVVVGTGPVALILLSGGEITWVIPTVVTAAALLGVIAASHMIRRMEARATKVEEK